MNDDITKAIQALESRLIVSASTPPDRTLWTRAEILAYLQVSENILRRYVDFPAPRIRVTDRSSGDRWIAKDVHDWAISRGFQAGRPRAA